MRGSESGRDGIAGKGGVEIGNPSPPWNIEGGHSDSNGVEMFWIWHASQLRECSFPSLTRKIFGNRKFFVRPPDLVRTTHHRLPRSLILPFLPQTLLEIAALRLGLPLANCGWCRQGAADL